MKIQKTSESFYISTENKEILPSNYQWKSKISLITIMERNKIPELWKLILNKIYYLCEIASNSRGGHNYFTKLRD